ncbi:MAG TPA: NADH-quinone oxidoreductase subunit M [Candidatus Xenobia bacterium]|nr:NADH-quinone oxidoreductase subunit M [Candidatus Xenobia bacterium]
MHEHWLSIVIFFPLLGALLLLFVPGGAKETLRRVAFLVSLGELALCVPLLLWFDSAQRGIQLAERHAWISSPPILYQLGLDGLSLVLVLLTALLTPISVLASWTIEKRVKEFFLMLLVLETGMIGVFLALDLFLFYVFWEVMLIPMYFLIGIWGHERRLYAAIKFILYTMAGSLLMLIAIIWLYLETGTFDLLQIQLVLQQHRVLLDFRTELLLFGAFFLAFAIKVPLFPFHTWLPDAHVEAPTAGSVILAGVLLKMGAYGLLRFCLPLFPGATQALQPLIAVLALISIIYGALVSMVQPNVKKLIAYSSVSHMGFVVLGIMALNETGLQGAILIMLAHGLSTGALFLLAGMLYDRRHTFQISDFGGLATPLPVFSSFLLFASLASLGLPPLVNWVGEFMVLIGTFRSNVTYASIAAFGVVLAAIYMLWMYQRVVFGEIKHEANRKLTDLSRRELAILIPLTVLIVALGLASPLITRRTQATVQRILLQTESPYYELAHRPAPEAQR